MLLKTKLTFKIKAATSTERTMKSCGGGRDIYYFWIKNSHLLALIEVWGKHEPGVCSEFRFKLNQNKVTPVPPKIIPDWLLEGSF